MRSHASLGVVLVLGKRRTAAASATAVILRFKLPRSALPFVSMTLTMSIGLFINVTPLGLLGLALGFAAKFFIVPLDERLGCDLPLNRNGY